MTTYLKGDILTDGRNEYLVTGEIDHCGQIATRRLDPAVRVTPHPGRFRRVSKRPKDPPTHGTTTTYSASDLMCAAHRLRLDGGGKCAKCGIPGLVCLATP